MTISKKDASWKEVQTQLEAFGELLESITQFLMDEFGIEAEGGEDPDVEANFQTFQIFEAPSLIDAIRNKKSPRSSGDNCRRSKDIFQTHAGGYTR